MKATTVIFRKEWNEYTRRWNALAIFPDFFEVRSGDIFVTCYAHVGQHSDMCRDYFADTKPVKAREEWLPLFHELKKIYGPLKFAKRLPSASSYYRAEYLRRLKARKEGGLL